MSFAPNFRADEIPQHMLYPQLSLVKSQDKQRVSLATCQRTLPIGSNIKTLHASELSCEQPPCNSTSCSS
jgi:hypothetical protein